MSALTHDFGLAWICMGAAFALHVFDEATHDFLAWYNPVALRLRRFTGPLRFPPVFTFWPWLLGLIAATIIFCALTPLAYEGRGVVRKLGLIFGIINTGNALLHLTAAAWLRRLVPGVWSSPLLLASAIWLIVAA